jgi:type II secretory pathway component PulC
MNKEIEQKIKDADLVLVGIGAEFENKKYCIEERARQALYSLSEVLKGKNYFLLTTCTNDILEDISFKTDRMVAPCGTLKKKQCELCENSVARLTEEDAQLMKQAIQQETIPFLTRKKATTITVIP